MIVVVFGTATIAAYLIGVRLYAFRYSRLRFERGRLVAFCAGVTIAAGIVLPPIDALVDASFAAHMVQHLVLALVVPPLLLLGAPLTLLVSLTPSPFGRKIARVMRHRVMLIAASPLVAWFVFVTVLWGIHFSPLYELALRSDNIHGCEHVLILGASLLFWMPVAQMGYAPHPIPFPVRLFYLFLAIPQGAFLGLTIYSARYLLYPHYLIGRSMDAALSDQRNAGAVMWIGGGALFFVAFMLTAAVWALRGHRAETIA